ncbi:hypothetical protein IGI04_030536 [Brassica rapa subsp. trilocularis]|uniref:Uncharacterized protein n=1 Tax=Brassica rapa subsp. trilocularis TaxID=1813537 RepID=A0ABQ7LR01_BRACM|nr:hypothetical protein IGI04_030536 [Brassica rapa subsp. trilocularis]
MQSLINIGARRRGPRRTIFKAYRTWENPDLSLAVTRHGSLYLGYSAQIAFSQLLGTDRSLSVARIDLSRSLDSLSCGYSARIALSRLLVSDSSLTVIWHRSFSRNHSDQSLAITRLALMRLLGIDCSLAITWLGSLSRSHSDCSQVSSMT